jgi:uncharacterized membrane protein YidH (DUF202 family)
MGTAFGEMLPLAVGIAISPTTIISTVLILLSPKAKTTSVALLVGCVVGIAVAVAFFAFLSSLLPLPSSSRTSPATGAILVAVGVLLLVLAARQWQDKPAKDDRAELPKWMASIDSISPAKALALGILLSTASPKNLLLALSAGVIVGGAVLSVGQVAVLIILFTVIAASTVAVPVVAYLVAPSRMTGPLEALREWLVDNSVAIMVVLLLVIGVVVIGNGIASFD